MKNKGPARGFLFLLLLMVFELISFKSWSQDEIAQALSDRENCLLKMPKASLKQPVNDTVLPTLCNSGRGLIHYELTCTIQERNSRNNVMKDSRNPMALRDECYTEAEWNNLIEQKRLMEEQFHLEWQKQVRKDKMDIQLGEIIKGFYMQPPF